METRRTFLASVALAAFISTAPGALAQASKTVEATGGITMPKPPKSATLKVPGATIYYETLGTGPMLLIIPGGPQDAGVFAELGQYLSKYYTVVAYDPRGNSRSTFDGATEDMNLDVQGDDAAALIEALGGGPAYVFGTSGGAQIGLNLAVRHPQLVRALVAHEPPSVMLLDDPSEALASDKRLYDTYRRDSVDAAMQMFFSENGIAPPPMEQLPPEAAATFARVGGNFEYWLAHGMIPLSHYHPDIAALRAGKSRITVAIGEQSGGQPIYGMGMSLAGKLGVQPVFFPGDHVGYMQSADAFARALHKVFNGD